MSVAYYSPDMQLAYEHQKRREETLVLQQCPECPRQVYALVDGKRCRVCEARR